jgi:hypothetical protein
MTLIVTSEFELNRVVAPRLPTAPTEYEKRYHDQFADVLRLYFNRLDNILGQLVTSMETIPVSIGGTNTDAFGRLRVSEPYTLFDSQSRFAADTQFDTSTSGTGASTFNTNQSSVSMSVTAGGVGSVVRQTYRSFPYQPGKGLLVLATFQMDNGTSANLNQKVGYFNTQNGVFFQRDAGINSFVVRSYTGGSVDNSRAVTQANWNGDKLDGTGASGLTLDLTHPQILWMDFEWLGVGSVRCGFVINGQYVVCHTFDTANVYGTTVYMTTAILPVRYEITTTTSAVAATLTQICSSVISEGGYEQYSYGHIARRTTALATISTTFLPLVSIRLASGRGGAVVLPARVQVLPTTSQNYEVALVKNATLTGASWVTSSSSSVQYDVSATAMSFPAASRIVQTDYVSSSGSGGTNPLVDPSGYNWDLQLGESLAGVSDIYTIAIRTVSGATTGDAVGSLTFWDLTNGT